MALKDLIASKASLAEDVIEEIVSEFVRFDPDHKAVVFTPKAHGLSTKARVLIYLVALQGWSFVVDDPVPADAKPSEITEHTGIAGGTLRPVLKELKDRHIIVQRGGRYSVRSVALQAIKSELGGSAINSTKPNRKSKLRADHDGESESEPPSEATGKRGRRSSGINKLGEEFDALINGGFFNKQKTLADVQQHFHKRAMIVPQTSMPPYLLKAVRSGQLERDKIEVNGRAVWAYTKKR